ncbi:MAG: endonuclease/exonuclease/phosphatase family protein [Phycisphaerae bacterium]|nr:endonuclease/exonuclease/phosphatase family protein [Phycisphaerae bacterium]
MHATLPSIAAAILAFLLTAAAAPPPATAPDNSALASLVATPARGELRVLVWNVQRGAKAFTDGPEKTLAVIRAVDPDVVLMQESYDIEGDRPTLGRWLAGELGWTAWQGQSPHLCVLTRLEVTETFFHEPWHALGARLVDGEGRSFVAYSIWIDYRAYTPYRLRDEPDVTDEELLACETTESNRFPQATAIIEHLTAAGHTTAPLPLLVGGDWNCPSHLDWTEDAARIFHFRRALDLPVSRAMAAAGFADAFRVVHPDPVLRPGITWSPLYRGTDEKPETADRIDRLYVHGGERPRHLHPVAATVIPRRLEDASVAVADRVFPSDHGGVVVDFEWR